MVKCFTCPRERRGDEPGWYLVDVPDRARAYGPARIYVCPRHYGHFAPQERGRWIEIVDVPVRIPAALAPAPAAGWLEMNATPADAAAGALVIIDTLAVDTVVSDS
jgi:hypothetical protein